MEIFFLFFINDAYMLKANCKIQKFDHNQLGLNDSFLLEEARPLNPTTLSFLTFEFTPLDLFFFPTEDAFAF